MGFPKAKFLSVILALVILVLGPGVLFCKQAQLCMQMEMDCCKHEMNSQAKIVEPSCCDDDTQTNSTPSLFACQNLSELKNYFFLSQLSQATNFEFRTPFLVFKYFNQKISEPPPSWHASTNSPLLC